MLHVSEAPSTRIGAPRSRGGAAASSGTGTAAAVMSCPVTSARERKMTADRTPKGGTEAIAVGGVTGAGIDANGIAADSDMNGSMVGVRLVAAAAALGPVPAQVEVVVA